MKIRSIQQVNQLACCPCDYPECDEPSYETKPPCGFTLPGDSPIESTDPLENAKTFTELAWSGTSYEDAIYNVYSDSYDYTYTRSQEEGCPLVTNGSGTSVIDSWYDEAQTIRYALETREWTWVDGVYSGTSHVTTYDEEGEITDDYTTVLEPVPAPGANYNFTVVSDLAIAGLTVTFIGADPSISADPEDYNGTQTLTFSGSSTIYRYGIPLGYTRSTYEIEWDEISASDAWWTWFDGGMEGTEPGPAPELVAHHSWIYDGSSDWSEWYELTETNRVANMLVTCWKSATIGNKPTAHGIEIAIDEPL